MATKCMSCGGSMKKMKTGGTSGCPPNQCKEWNIDKTSYSCKPCKSVQVARAAIAAISTAVQNAFTSKAGKNREAIAAAKKAAEEAANTPTAKFTKKLDETLKTKKMGEATKKKYARGGTTGGYAPAQKGGDNTKNGIYGMSQQNMGTSSQYTPVAKKGGAVKKAKLAAMAPPKGKITRADIITAAKRNAKKKK